MLLFSATAVRTAWLSRPIPYLMRLSSLAYWAQGWTAGSEGFSSTHVMGIEAAEVVNVIRAIWLLAAAGRISDAIAVRAG